MVQSLEIISQSMGNYYYHQALALAAEKVEKGQGLSESLEPYSDLFGSMIIQIMKVGEETGETAGLLETLSKSLESEVTRTIQNLSSIIEPVIILLLGGVVGFMAVSVIQPIYSMMGAM